MRLKVALLHFIKRQAGEWRPLAALCRVELIIHLDLIRTACLFFCFPFFFLFTKMFLLRCCHRNAGRFSGSDEASAL